MLYIVCRDSNLYSSSIKSILEDKLGELNYEILDPKCHSLDRTFSTVLVLTKKIEQAKAFKIDANKIFYTLPPDANLDKKEKLIIFKEFKEAVEYVRTNTLTKEILETDLPRFIDLQEFLHGFKGQVMEIKLQDGRLIGIYPDKEKFHGIYSVEFHVSTILNLAKLQDIFNFTKLSIKDL